MVAKESALALLESMLNSDYAVTQRFNSLGQSRTAPGQLTMNTKSLIDTSESLSTKHMLYHLRFVIILRPQLRHLLKLQL